MPLSVLGIANGVIGKMFGGKSNSKAIARYQKSKEMLPELVRKWDELGCGVNVSIPTHTPTPQESENLDYSNLTCQTIPQLTVNTVIDIINYEIPKEVPPAEREKPYYKLMCSLKHIVPGYTKYCKNEQKFGAMDSLPENKIGKTVLWIAGGLIAAIALIPKLMKK